MEKTLKPCDIRNILREFIDTSTNDKLPPSRYRFAKVSGYSSYNSLQRAMRKFGEEGSDVLEEIDNEINIWLIDWLSRATTKEQIQARKHILAVQGLSDKRGVDVSLSHSTSNNMAMDLTLSERIKALSKKENKKIEDNVNVIETKAEMIEEDE